MRSPPGPTDPATAALRSIAGGATPRRLAIAVLLVAGVFAGCRDSGAPGGGPAGEVAAVPRPDLSAADPLVRDQVVAAQGKADELLASADTAASAKADAFADLALVYLTYDFIEAAEVSLQNAVALDTEAFRGRYLLGYLYKVQGRTDESAALLSQVLEQRPDYLPAVIRLGQLRLEAGDAAAAEKLFRRALEIDPRAAAAHEGLGRVAQARGDDATAIAELETALAIQPSASSLHYLLGQAYRRSGDLAKARSELERRGDAPVRVDDPLLQPMAQLAQSAQFYVVQAGEALADDKVEEAADSFRRALEIEPKSFVARRGLAYCLQRLGDAEGAEQQLLTALETSDDPEEQGEAEAILGGMLAGRGADAEAARHLARAVDLAPERAGLRLKLGDALVRLGRFDAALAEYDRLLSAGVESSAVVLARRGAVYVNLGRREAALADYRRAVAAAPDDPDVHLRYAEALDFFGDHAGAGRERAAAERLSGGGDERVGLYAGEGRLAATRGDLPAAVEKYRAALALDPDRFDVRYALASVLAQRASLGQASWDEAIVEYGKVIAASPDHAAARRGEIAALVLSGRFGPARVRLNEAMSRYRRDRELALTQARLLAAAPDPQVRDGRLAVAVAERVRQAHDDLLTLDTLALAYAAAGRYPEAARTESEAITKAQAAGAGGAVALLERRLAAYRAGRAWAIESPEELLALRPAGSPASR